MQGHFSPLRHRSQLALLVLKQSVSLKDPAWLLYKKKARSSFFMVESLTRILLCIKEDKLVAKGFKKSKKVEDMLGRIEDYDNWYHSFGKLEKVGKKELDYFLRRREKEVRKLNQKLSKADHYKKLFGKLAAKDLVDFNDRRLIEQLEEELRKEMQQAFEFFQKFPKEFTELEEQVHELRRRLRWFSIYAQSFDGMIALDKIKTVYKWEKEFRLSEQDKSPYGKLPVDKKLKTKIHFNSKAFWALNHVIDELGKIKDQAYELEELREALQARKNSTRKAALKEASRLLGISYTEKDLLRTAHALLYKYFIQFKIHELLLSK